MKPIKIEYSAVKLQHGYWSVSLEGTEGLKGLTRLAGANGKDFFLDVEWLKKPRLLTEDQYQSFEENVVAYNKRTHRWKPNFGQCYYAPIYYGSGLNQGFRPMQDVWENFASDNARFATFPLSKTAEECQPLCDILNKALKPALDSLWEVGK